jgi:predicted nuclease of predicted toxin-antitoxin system
LELLSTALSPKTVQFLRERGHIAIRANEIGLADARDADLIKYAADNDMIVITADLDFGGILAYTKRKKPSVIIFRLRDPSPDHVNFLLSLVLPQVEECLSEGSIVIVEDDKVRVRGLPIEMNNK